MRCVWALGLLAGMAGAAEPGPCRPGLKEGQRPGPYSAVVSVGEHRGTSHCFICETAERPLVIVFARSLSDPLGKLAAGLDKAKETHNGSELRAWVTFLHADQSAFDPLVVKWAKKHALRDVPLAVFEDPDGPPSYKLSRDADVTVICAVKQKAVAAFAFRVGELNDARITEVLKAVQKVGAK